MNQKILTTAIVIAAAAVIALTPTTVNLKATVIGPPPEPEQGIRMEQHFDLPSGEKERVIESNEHSAQASNRLERSFDLEVDPENGAGDDEPAHESTRTVVRGEDTTITSTTSAAESSNDVAVNNAEIEQENQAEQD